jgi:hypothetical protein
MGIRLKNNKNYNLLMCFYDRFKIIELSNALNLKKNGWQ